MDKKLGRCKEHREATLASLVCALIEHKRIRTTLAKAKEARRLAEHMVTLAKKKEPSARRLAVSILRSPGCVARLFNEIAPGFAERTGGYTRIVKLGWRTGDGAQTAILEWVGTALPQPRKGKAKEDAKTD
jgi:large subunit ribosomal protein L17